MYLEIDNLTKTIKGTTVLDGVTLSLERGRVYGLRGKNGSGKTMLMRAITGLIRPTSGTVAIEGKIIGKDESFPPSVGILLENPAFVSKYTGFKNLQVLADIQKNIGAEVIHETLQKVGLDPSDKRPYRKYSLGMKQRLGIACAVMESPDLILLDEPINALDPTGVDLVKSIIMEHKKRGALLLIACHDAQELDYLSDEVYYMAEGRITGHEVPGGDAL